MATTSDELEQYQQIDRERQAAEADMARKKGLRRWNRLMPADEVRFFLPYTTRYILHVSGPCTCLISCVLVVLCVAELDVFQRAGLIGERATYRR